MQTLRQHPDLGGEAEAAQLLNEAVAILCDPVKRANYDHERIHSTGRNVDSPEPSTPLTALPNIGTAVAAVSESCLFCKASTPLTAHSASLPYGDENLCHRCGAARTTAAKQLDNPFSTTRNEHRTAHTAIATLWQHWPLSDPMGVRVVDLSVRGAALVCDSKVSTNQTVLLKSPIVNAIARIRYCHLTTNDDHVRIGLAFLTLRMTSPPGEFLAMRA